MISVAIVEDEQNAVDRLKLFFERFEKEHDEFFQLTHFVSAELFLSAKQGIYDIVLMDIELPGINGMKASEYMRKHGDRTVLIFVTNMAQYAIKGYEVDALDFIVKPVVWPSFELKLQKALRHVRMSENRSVFVSTKSGMRKLPLSAIYYVEVSGHHLLYHMDGETVDVCGSLSELEEKTADMGFARCNSCYLVNLKYVSEVRGNDVRVGPDILKISRTKKKMFMEQLTQIIGE
mgnify:CR=1 FL=1